jgi:RHS repeat-associated protein
MTETFKYDNLDRLDTVLFNNTVSRMEYDTDGNMTRRTSQGVVVFKNASVDSQARPHAVTGAEVNSAMLPDAQTVLYTMHDKVKRIEQGDDYLAIDYGYDRQRIGMSEWIAANQATTRKLYVGSCEFNRGLNREQRLTYISGPLGVFAVYEQLGELYKGGGDSDDSDDDGGDEDSFTGALYYLHRDHLGSVTTITNSSGAIVQELSYDAWGNLRNPYTWSGSFTGTPKFDRGFTGHEHHSHFGLINMNGRMYDPLMCSFLSVDNYVQAPDFSQSFNRYAYCLNNPLRYVDPSGEFVITTGVIIAAAAIIGAGIGTYQGYKTAVSQGLTSWDMAGKMVLGGLIGAASGAASAGVGVAVGGAVAAAGIGGFWGGCITGGVSGFVGGGINGYGMSRLAGNTIEQSLTTSITSGLIGMGTGALLGGVSSGIASSIKGNNFWNGKALPTPRPAVEPLPELTPKSAQSITSDKLSMTPIEEGNYTVQVTIEGEYSVYYGKNSEEAVKYVGITKRNPEIRWAEHLASNTERNTLEYHLVQEATGLTKNQARIIEQQYINLYGLEKNGGQLLNQINSIAPSRWNSFNIRIDVIQVPKLP